MQRNQPEVAREAVTQRLNVYVPVPAEFTVEHEKSETEEEIEFQIKWRLE